MKSIILNTESVQGILANRITVTRQPIKNICTIQMRSDDSPMFFDRKARELKSPYQIGDILYVKETCYFETFECFPLGTGNWVYKADNIDYPATTGWTPSIHMPREAARIFLRVTDVRVERLQDIDTMQIKAEGIYQPCINCVVNDDCNNLIKARICTLRSSYIKLWNSRIKKQDLKKYGWNANPYCWVTSSERISKEEAEVGK